MVFLSKTWPRPESVLFFLTLTVHSPLPLTVPLGLFCLFFGLLSLSSKPHSPSPVYVFPGSFLFGPFSSLSVWVYWWFLSVPVLLSSIHFPFSFSLFLCYFSASLSPRSVLSPLSLLPGAGVGSLFIGPRERGLFIAVHGERGSAGLAGQWAWPARCGAPDFSSSRLGVSRLLQGTRLTGINEERGRKLSTFPCCTSGGRRKKNSVAQNDTVLPCFFLFLHETTSFYTKRAVSFKCGASKFFFKSVLNYFLFISIASLSISSPPSYLAAFSTLVLGLWFMQFDPQLINKLLISSIWPLILLITAPIFTRLFQFGPWFRIFLIKSLIGH